MRALLDTNVYVSYLLARDAASPPTLAVRAGLPGAYGLLVSRVGLAELRSKVTTKRHLATRIPIDFVEELFALLGSGAELVPEYPPPYPAIGRDRGDDYLIAHALSGRADYLVSGDADLTALGRVESVAVVDPAQFLAVLRASGAV